MRMCVPIIEKCELDKRCLPTEKLLPLKKKDLEYKEGTKMPTLNNISNDMYTAGMNKLDGKDFYGSYVVDTDNGHKVCNEVSKEFKFWNMWNDKGNKGYFCPEPMTAMINSPNLSLPNEVSGYEEITKEHIDDWVEKFEEYVKKQKNKKLIKQGQKVQVNLDDEAELFKIVDRYLVAIENEEIDAYWQDWKL